MKKLLATARASSLKLAIASSSSRVWIERWLKELEIGAYFEAVVCREDVARTKPSPEVFLLAAQRLGVPPAECLIFEDSPHGAQAAKNARIFCVVVPNSTTRRLEFPRVFRRYRSFDRLDLPALTKSISLAEGIQPAEPDPTYYRTAPRALVSSSAR